MIGKGRPALSARVAKIMEADQAGLTSSESEFLADMVARRISFGTPRQNVWVDQIGRKVFGADNWEAFRNGGS